MLRYFIVFFIGIQLLFAQQSQAAIKLPECIRNLVGMTMVMGVVGLEKVQKLLVGEEPETDLDKSLRQFHDNADRDAGIKFAALMNKLPAELKEWQHWFYSVSSDGDRQYYSNLAERNKVAFENGGPEAQKLLRYGLTPISFLLAGHGIELLLERIPRHLGKETSFPTHRSEVLAKLIVPGHEPVLIGPEMILSQIRGDSTLMPHQADSVMKWFFAALEHVPDLVPGYTAQKQDGVWVFQSRSKL